MAEIITVQYYEAQKIDMSEIDICSVKAKSQTGKIWVKDTMIKQKDQSRKKIN